MGARYVKHKRRYDKNGYPESRKTHIFTNQNAQRLLDEAEEEKSYVDGLNTVNIDFGDFKGYDDETADNNEHYYLPAAPDKMRMQAFEYTWFSMAK